MVACKWTLIDCGLDEPLINNALVNLGSAPIMLESERLQLRELALRLDERYMDLQDAVDRDLATPEDLQRAFRRARAAAAVDFACGTLADNHIEALYEAAMAAGERRPEFLKVVFDQLHPENGRT